MADRLRIPFEIAISEPNLMQAWFEALSLPQQVALKVMYGAPLSAEKRDNRGWSELDYWAMLQESCEYDPLGYLTKVTPVDYVPREYQEAWAVVGVRGGKTDRFAATITAYEATCGGHEAYARPGRPLIAFQVAQDLRMARYSLHSIKGAIESMPWCKDWITQVTADRIDLRNGVTVAVTPPTIKSIRGYDSPISVLDEVGVWPTEADAANQDEEIYNQAISRQAQFEFPKLVGISSAWVSHGLLYNRWAAGTDGAKLICTPCRETPKAGCPTCAAMRQPHRGRLVVHTTTAGLGNPLVRKQWLESRLASDPRVFARECLSRFQESASGFLDPDRIDQVTEPGLNERPPDKDRIYVAAIDPAFRRDTFALTIVHADPDLGVVQDVSRRWRPQAGAPLNPELIFSEMAPLLKAYNVVVVYTDQYQFESLYQLALKHGIGMEPVDFTATSKAGIYGSLKALLNQHRLRLLDLPEQVRELKLLEMRLSGAGTVQIAAPEGQHDDLATVLALAAHKAVWLLPTPKTPDPPPETYQDVIARQLERRRTARYIDES